MKTKKTKKPAYIVDLTKCINGDDVKFAFIKARAIAGDKIKPEEFDFIVEAVMFDTFAFVISAETSFIKQFINFLDKIEKPKKLPWYKRAWNWITRKK